MHKKPQHKQRQGFVAMLTIIARLLARSGLPEILMIATLVLSRYNNNIDFSYPIEIVIPTLLLGAIAAGLYYVYLVWLKSVVAAHGAAMSGGYLLYSYTQAGEYFGTFSKWLLPGKIETAFSTSVVAFVVVVVVAGALGLLIARTAHVKQVRGLQLGKVIVFAVVFSFGVQFSKAAFKWIEIYPQLSYAAQYTPPKKLRDATSKPDVYYIVLDRYANNETLQSEFSFDNSKFTESLQSLGFVVRSDAYANYPFTMSSISSTLAMGYHTELGKQFGGASYQTAFPYRSILNNPPVAQALKQEGYTYNQVSSWWDFTRVGIHADNQPTLSFRLTVLGRSFYLSDLQRDIVNKSILSPWLKKGINIGGWRVLTYDQDDNPRQNLEKQLNALTDLARTPRDAPQFTFAHVLSPHDPYIFAADGSDPSYDEGRNDDGADELIKYTNQMTYLNSRIQKLLADIRQSSPGAVIIVQADEGPYPKDFRYAELSPTHYYDPVNLSDAKMAQKFGVLSAVYMPGVDTSDANQGTDSSVNVLRGVLNQYLGYDMPPLPDCHYATGNKFVLYRYQEVGGRLPGADDSSCTSR